jgi:hypothetical protein
MFLIRQSRPLHRFYAVLLSLNFNAKCGLNLVRIPVINLILFCTFFLLLFSIIVRYLCICVQLHSSIHLATGPVLISLYVSKLNSNELCYRYIHEKIPSLKNFYFIRYNIINDVLGDTYLFPMRFLYVICKFFLLFCAVCVTGLMAVVQVTNIKELNYYTCVPHTDHGSADWSAYRTILWMRFSFKTCLSLSLSCTKRV